MLILTSLVLHADLCTLVVTCLVFVLISSWSALHHVLVAADACTCPFVAFVAILPFLHIDGITFIATNTFLAFSPLSLAVLSKLYTDTFEDSLGDAVDADVIWSERDGLARPFRILVSLILKWCISFKSVWSRTKPRHSFGI